MVFLVREDIETAEVLDWRGIHLLHFVGSSCSQKTRIFLNLKGIDWTPHHVDLARGENYTEWFMGINPRGLVPVLVDDGQVIIESNDILLYLDTRYPEPGLIPPARDVVARQYLDQEDELHLDLRALSMRYVFPASKVVRSDEALARYEKFGSGTVRGERDPHKDVELQFFRDMQKNNGITDDQVRQSVARFRAAFSDFDRQLATAPYLLGEALSVVDIAWYVYSVRLRNAGYPLQRLHPNVGHWFERLDARDAFRREVTEPEAMVAMREEMHAQQRDEGDSLVQVAKLG